MGNIPEGHKKIKNDLVSNSKGFKEKTNVRKVDKKEIIKETYHSTKEVKLDQCENTTVPHDLELRSGSLSSNHIDLQTQGGSLWKDIRSIYKFKQVIGGGQYGTVRVGYRANVEPKKLVAIKSIKKNNVKEFDIDCMMKEVELLSMLEHPNIIKFHETYNDEFYFHVVMDLCKGKDVFDTMIDDGIISESKVNSIVYKLISAVYYCHQMGICHRDIKPENILFEDEKNEGDIKLLDFGLSQKYINTEKMRTILGTPYYVAPEVLTGEYDERVDMWSIGAFTYVLLAGEPPFHGKSNSETFKKIVNDQLSFPEDVFSDISNEAIDFISQCLQKDPDKRLLSREASSHLWFKDLSSKFHDYSRLDAEVLWRFREFKHHQKFKKMVLKFLMNEICQVEVLRLRKMFQALDYNNSGLITAQQIVEGFKFKAIGVPEEEIKALIDKIDDKNGGRLDTAQFIIACIDTKKYFDQDKMALAFRYFDIDKSGYIEVGDIENSFLRSGQKLINSEEVKRIIEEIVVSDKHRIPLTAFMKMFD